jgi:nucleoside-diphosphate-sugar epimerase
MKRILITGATGLMGSVICADLRAIGRQVRGLVRNPHGPDIDALRALGVEIMQGDVSEIDSVIAAAKGVDGIIHCAAMLGSGKATISEGFSVNVMGALAVLSAAARLGDIPVAQVITTTFLDSQGKTLTENTKLDLTLIHQDPYSITKRLAFVEGLARAQAGQNIRFVIPGAIFGPSPCLERANAFPGFNWRLLVTIRGEMPELPALMITASYVTDCSRIAIAALDRGEKGKIYIAHGRPDDDCTLPAFCNLAAEMAGSPHRVAQITPAQADDPEMIERFGPNDTILKMLREKPARPLTDSRITQREFGIVPTSLKEGMRKTIDWFRENRLIPG